MGTNTDKYKMKECANMMTNVQIPISDVSFKGSSLASSKAVPLIPLIVLQSILRKR